MGVASGVREEAPSVAVHRVVVAARRSSPGRTAGAAPEASWSAAATSVGWAGVAWRGEEAWALWVVAGQGGRGSAAEEAASNS